jgi:hypothetical protein
MDVQLTCYVDAGKVTATPVQAITENISRTGILMRWTAGTPLPAVDSRLVLDLELPENSEFGTRMMRCQATVVRVLPVEGRGHEIALKVRSMRFVRTKPVVRTYDLERMPVASDRVS